MTFCINRFHFLLYRLLIIHFRKYSVHGSNGSRDYFSGHVPLKKTKGICSADLNCLISARECRPRSQREVQGSRRRAGKRRDCFWRAAGASQRLPLLSFMATPSSSLPSPYVSSTTDQLSLTIIILLLQVTTK